MKSWNEVYVIKYKHWNINSACMKQSVLDADLSSLKHLAELWKQNVKTEGSQIFGSEILL